MWRYVVRRLLYLPVVIILVSTLVFVLVRLPFARDPVALMLPMDATTQQRQDLRHELELDQPIPVQYVHWIGRIARGDLGNTFRGHQPVWREIERRLPVTLELATLAILTSNVIGVTIGILSAMRQKTVIDYVARIGAVFGQSVPEFFTLVLLIVLPSIWWNYSPPVGGHISLFEDPWSNIRLYVPAAILLGLTHAAGMMRLTRSTMLEVFRQDYIRTARAKGLRQKDVIVHHALRNALVPLFTVFSGQVASLLFGSLVFETIFSVQGIGQFFFQSLQAADMPVVQALTMYTAIIVILVNLMQDLAYPLLDRRVVYR